MSGDNIFERWKREKAALRAEFVAGNISVTFTGELVHYPLSELRLARFDDEMSIAISVGNIVYFSKVKGSLAAIAHFKNKYICAIRIITNAGATCMIYELRNQS